jgi:CO/xanthine dehydrogenase FAD-binding subunit
VTALGYKDSTCASGFRFRLALTSVAPVPLMPVEVETYLANNPVTPDAIHEAARLAYEACSPIDDVRGSARYRKQMVRNLSVKALTEVWKNLG